MLQSPLINRVLQFYQFIPQKEKAKGFNSLDDFNISEIKIAVRRVVLLLLF